MPTADTLTFYMETSLIRKAYFSFYLEPQISIANRGRILIIPYRP